MAVQVATACAEKIQGFRPVILSINGTTVRFEGGVVVKTHLIDLNEFLESWRKVGQEWVVTNVEVWYYQLDKEFVRISDEKVREIWDHDQLTLLKMAHRWHHPRIVDPATVKGRVGYFWNNGEAHGYVAADPEYNQEGHYTFYETEEYGRLIPGDKERALKKAREELATLNS